MIRPILRSLFLLIGVSLGLALAALTQGNVSHLRLLAGERTPEWTKPLSPSSTFLHGSSTIPNTHVALHWTFQKLSLDGLQYTLRFQGQNVDLRGEMTVPFSMQVAQVTQMQGALDLDPFYAQSNIKGTLTLSRLEARIDLSARMVVALTGQGLFKNGQFNGVALGQGELVLQPTQAGAWLGSITLEPPNAGLDVSIRGTFDQAPALVEGNILDGTEMPDTWRRWLNANLPRTPRGWQIDQTIDLTAPVLGQ